MNTLLLDQTTWGLCVDALGNIAMATEPYSVAQDASSAIRLFQGELWFDTTKGVPWFSTTLGRLPPASVIKAQMVAAALTVPDCVAATAYITGFTGRAVTGQVQVTTAAGDVVVLGGVSTAPFSVLLGGNP